MFPPLRRRKTRPIPKAIQGMSSRMTATALAPGSTTRRSLPEHVDRDGRLLCPT